MHWVVAYDVSENRRRARVAKRLERAGLRVQKSVFLIDVPPYKLRSLMRELGAVIDHETDQVAAWRLTTELSSQAETGFPAGPQFQQTLVW